jgi:hypothetical protein
VKGIDTPRLGRAITIVPASWRSSPASPAANGGASSGRLRMMQGRAELAPCATRVVRLPLGVNDYRVAADSTVAAPADICYARKSSLASKRAQDISAMGRKEEQLSP